MGRRPAEISAFFLCRLPVWQCRPAGPPCAAQEKEGKESGAREGRRVGSTSHYLLICTEKRSVAEPIGSTLLEVLPQLTPAAVAL